MRARVPNFANGTSNGFNNNNKNSKKENLYKMNGGVKGKLARNSQQNGSPSSMSNSNSAPNLAQLPGAAHPFWWHSRLYPDSGGNLQYYKMKPIGILKWLSSILEKMYIDFV